MAVDLPIKGASFPVEAVSALKLKREPHIHKAPVGQDYTQFVVGTSNLGVRLTLEMHSVFIVWKCSYPAMALWANR
jgi:hypothetical protein